MPTLGAGWRAHLQAHRFNHPKMWGDMPTMPSSSCTETIMEVFQSSEDVGGHADPRPSWSFWRWCSEFQSSEDVGGHADKTSIRRKPVWVPRFQSSEDVGGHADKVCPDAKVRFSDTSFNHPKMWGDMPTLGLLAIAYLTGSFNHPKMWGDMPTRDAGLHGHATGYRFQSSEDVGGHADHLHPRCSNGGG